MGARPRGPILYNCSMRIFAVLFAVSWLAAQPLPLSTPEREGLSPERLNRLHENFRQTTEKGERSGAITMVVRNGKIADWHTYGYRDIEAKLPMEKDTICRIWSMTKVVTSVAALMLIEEGKLNLEDEVSRFAPELKSMQVFVSGTADAPNLVKATRPINVKHLLTHTSGLSYNFYPGPVAELYNRAKIFEAATLKEFVGKAGGVPLASQPGEVFHYGMNTDVLGYVVEAASDMPFERFVQTRILDPLKMKDTSFSVPQEKRGRLAKTYTLKNGRLTAQADNEFLKAGGAAWGGMGLYSTIGDYSRFAQMLLNGGQLDGVRLLSRKTVELMTANHLNHLPVQTIAGSASEGFGLGVSVRLDVAKSNSLGSVGKYGWTGAASTIFINDPKERTVALLFLQHMPYDSSVLEKFSTLFYQAIAD